MRKGKRKSGHKTRITDLVLVTAIINLIIALIDLIKSLLD